MKTNYLIAGVLFAAALLFLPAARAVAAEDLVKAPEHSEDQTRSLEAHNTPFYREIDTYPQVMTMLDVSQRITQKIAEDPHRLSIAATWARDRSIGAPGINSVNAFYFMFASDLTRQLAGTVSEGGVFYKQYMHDAFQSLLMFDVMLRTNIARCRNPVDKSIVQQLTDERFDALQDAYKNATPDEMSAFMDMALQFEDAAASRPHNDEICTNGLAVALAQQAGLAKIPEMMDAAYVDDTFWTAARDEARKAAKASWKKRYESFAKYRASVKKQEEQARAAALYKAQAAAAAQKAREDAARAKADAAAAQKAADDAAAAKTQAERAGKQQREKGRYRDNYVAPAYVPSESDAPGGY